MQDNIKKIVSAALAEDVGSGDITAALISEKQIAQAKIISRESGIFCGIPYANEVSFQVNPNIEINWQVKESDTIFPEQIICEIKGNARSLLVAERTILNFLQTLSGTATLTYQHVKKLKGTQAKLLDTRKTIPGLRQAQKYAVRCGGGCNHRIGLYDAYLIKENHIAACGSIEAVVAKARTQDSSKFLEVEVENLKELQQALDAGVDRILLDNFSVKEIYEAVAIVQNKVELEISGNINLDNILDYAKTGVDYISVGSITKHIRALDMSMRFY